MTERTASMAVTEGGGFNPAALREKYRFERDRRRRADGSAQYVRTTGKYAHYLDDPYADPNFTRDPITEDV